MPAVAAFLVYQIGATALGFFGVTASVAVSMALGSTSLAIQVAAIRRVSKLKDPGQTAVTSGMSFMVESTEAPANIVFGEAQVGGVISYKNTTGNELRSAYLEIVHTGHEIECAEGYV